MLCQKFGSIEFLKILPDYETEPFCSVYHAKYNVIQSARFAKKQLDDRSFFGGVLHVCYAPELETLEETRNKLAVRKREIEQRLHPELLKTENAEPISQNLEDPIPSQSSLGTPLRLENSSTIPSKTPIIRCAPLKRIVYHKRKHSGISLPSIISKKSKQFEKKPFEYNILVITWLFMVSDLQEKSEWLKLNDANLCKYLEITGKVLNPCELKFFEWMIQSKNSNKLTGMFKTWIVLVFYWTTLYTQEQEVVIRIFSTDGIQKSSQFTGDKNQN